MRRHRESHAIDRAAWLRAAILGANDGIVSTASLIVGIASAAAGRDAIIMTGVAGLVAGAMSMAAGEYVSVSSQADAERADREREAHELATDPDHEREELVGIYQARGLDRDLAEQVADRLTANDALGAHLRDELGITEQMAARPIQAAIASAAAFSAGAALPLGATWLSPAGAAMPVVSIVTLLSLALLGGLGAWIGNAPVGKGLLRVTFWGAFALAATAGIGSLFGTALG